MPHHLKVYKFKPWADCQPSLKEYILPNVMAIAFGALGAALSLLHSLLHVRAQRGAQEIRRVAMIADGTRDTLVRRALQLEWLAIAWMTVEAAVAIGSAVTSHSLSLLAFGADSVIELASAGVLLWRLNVELRQGSEFREEAEQRASRISGLLLFVIAVYVAASAAYGLWTRAGQEFSAPGLAVTVLAIPIMWWIAKEKIRVAAPLGSQALRADAIESVTCGYLSSVVAFGLIVQLIMPGWWWVDGVASVAIVLLLIREGREAWQGKCC